MTVSVVLPVRNRVGHVEAAARSVLAQTWTDLELVVVDGASTDGTRDVLHRLAAEDDRVRLVLHEHAEGVSHARNSGAAAARRHWLAFQDSDDHWDRRLLELQLAAIAAEPGARAGYCGYRRTRPGKDLLVPRNWRRVARGPVLERVLRQSFIGTPQLVVERALFHEVGGFDEAIVSQEDWDLVVRLAERTPFACVPAWLVEGPLLADALSADTSTYRSALARLLARHDHLLERHPAAREYRWARHGLIEWSGGNGPAGRAGLRRALGVRPWSLHGPTVRAGWDLWRTRRLQALQRRAERQTAGRR